MAGAGSAGASGAIATGAGGGRTAAAGGADGDGRAPGAGTTGRSIAVSVAGDSGRTGRSICWPASARATIRNGASSSAITSRSSRERAPASTPVAGTAAGFARRSARGGSPAGRPFDALFLRTGADGRPPVASRAGAGFLARSRWVAGAAPVGEGGAARGLPPFRGERARLELLFFTSAHRYAVHAGPALPSGGPTRDNRCHAAISTPFTRP